MVFSMTSNSIRSRGSKKKQLQRILQILICTKRPVDINYVQCNLRTQTNPAVQMLLLEWQFGDLDT